MLLCALIFTKKIIKTGEYMKKQLFFDDNKLFSKENVIRKYGKPSLVCEYVDAAASTDYCGMWVFPLDGGGYRMLYFGHSKDYEGHKLFVARSADGVHFTPDEVFPEKKYAHEVLDIGKSEVAFIYEDKHTDDPSRRYIMLRSGVNPNMIKVDDDVYVSADLLHWDRLEGALWGDGAEPLASVFYNEELGVHTVMERPFWGIRCAGYKETKDFINYTEFRYCMNVDSLDGDLSEIYGMYVFSYDGNYIGIPHIYHGFGSGLETKYKSGLIDTQLAYSKDGRYFQRSLREPFLTGTDGTLAREYKLLWVSSITRIGNDILLYATASEEEHGPAFSKPGTGRILIFRLREDGFISLSTDRHDEESVIATREKIWHGGDAHINLRAEHATLAVYSTRGEAQDMNILGTAERLEGFTHEDCIAFSGDSTDWIPEYKSGRRLSELSGETVVLELKFKNGEVYSFGGDFTDIFNVEGAVYRRHGITRL